MALYMVPNLFMHSPMQRSCAAKAAHVARGVGERFPLLRVFFVVPNYSCLMFMQIHTRFYFNYIIYYGLLIFCCQNVAIFLILYCWFYFE